MIQQQIYSSNSTRPYPFEEGQDNPVPDDILVDASISVPEGVEPVVVAVTRTDSLFFLAIEDSATGKALGHIAEPYPAPFAVYRLKTFDDSVSGWVVPGSGISNTFTYSTELSLDRNAVLQWIPVSTGIDSMTVNEISSGLHDVVGMRLLSSMLYISTESRNIEGVGEKECIVIKRNDGALSRDIIYSGLTEVEAGSDGIRSIAGAFPDASGNIVINLEPPSLHLYKIKTAAGEDTGFLVSLDGEICSEYDPVPKVLHGRCEQGLVWWLPCDHLIVEGSSPLLPARAPEFANEDCGCED